MSTQRLPRLRRLIVPPLRASGLRHLIIPPLRAYFRYCPVQVGKLAVWKYVAAHLWWLETRVRANTRLGTTLDVDARDGLGRFIYYFGVWEPHLTSYIQGRLKHGDCFVDVGANVGYFSILASTLFGTSGTVVSIEAISRTFDVLIGNIERNHATNVRAINRAVWDKEERLTFFVSADTIDGTSTVVPAQAHKYSLKQRCDVSAAPLSSLLRIEEIARARLMKIDVEGAERRLLGDLASVLERGRRDLEIVMEVSADAFDEIVTFFRKRGFVSYRLENDYTPASYIARGTMNPVRRLEVLADGETHVDLVFSRIDAPSLQ